MMQLPLDTEEERNLIAAAVGGDRLALHVMLLAYRSELLRYVERQMPTSLRETIDAEDVVQEAHLLAYRGISSFTPSEPGHFGAWLRTIARNRLLDMLKEQARLKRGGGRIRRLAGGGPNDDQDMVELLETLAVYRRTPSVSAAAHELAMALERSIERLPEDWGAALRLRHMEGLDIRSAAERMQRTEEAYRKLCSRGYERLRTLLKSGSIYA